VLDQNKKYKIALIGDCLSLGGAEKVMALLSIYFSKNGFEVHNCIFADIVSYEYSGSLLNLGQIKPKSNSITRKIYRFIEFQKFIKNSNFDFMIDFRMPKFFFLEFLLYRIIFPKNTVYTVHSGNISYYFPRINFFAKLIYKNKNVITVSNAIENQLIKTKISNSIQCIYNPIDLVAIQNKSNDYVIKDYYITAISRFIEVKQLDKLIIAYSKSNLPSNDVKLIICGHGELKQSYLNLIKELDLKELIEIKDFQVNPFPIYKNALFSVLSSANEGFPNSIIESLACETPVVAFDCFSGPREVITNHENGILVENQNFDKLTEAMNLMASDQKLYQHCKQNAAKSVEKFSIENIGKLWLDYLAQKI
jgi:glycosyltransferase involved in cell wall biosynthesis